MARNPERTRQQIMDAAEKLIYGRGFGGTSVDEVIHLAGVTKGAFFHHFKTKAELGRALVERYAALDAAHLDGLIERASRLSRDPVQQVLLIAALLEEELGSLEAPFPGCLYASYCAEAQLFDDATKRIVAAALRHWRERLGPRFDAALAAQPPRVAVTGEELTDCCLAAFEGGLILAKALDDPALLAGQLRRFRDHLELLFDGPPRGSAQARGQGA